MSLELNQDAIVFSSVVRNYGTFSLNLLKRYSISSEHFSKYSFRKEIIDSLPSYKVVIFLINSGDENLIYYLGLCDALNLNTVIFIQTGLPLNPILSSRLFCYVDFDDPSWYTRFAVQIYLSQSLKDLRPVDLVSEKNFSINRNYYLNNFNGKKLISNINSASSERELSNLVETILLDSNITFNREKRINAHTRLRADFIIWSQELEHILGNPIILEIKNRRFHKDDVQQIETYIALSESAIGIVLYFNFTDSDRDMFNSTSTVSNVAAYDLSQFIITYLAMDFKNAVLKCFS